MQLKTLAKVHLPDTTATALLGAKLASHAEAPFTLLLEGDLGMGKTLMAQAFIRALADDDALSVTSPTFTLVQTYSTDRGDVWHYDLYRLTHESDMEELGWDEAQEGISVVEWADRMPHLHTRRGLKVILREAPDGGRTAELIPLGWGAA